MSAGARTLALVNAVEIGAVDFERCVSETQRTVFAIALAVLGSRDEAQDVTQDVFLTAFHKRSHLRDPERFRAWVARTAYRLALNRRRGQQRARTRDEAVALDRPADNDPYSVVAARLDNQRLRAAVDELPEKLRAVVILCAVDGLEARTVGAALHIPEGTVRSRLHVARKRLLRKLYP